MKFFVSIHDENDVNILDYGNNIDVVIPLKDVFEVLLHKDLSNAKYFIIRTLESLHSHFSCADLYTLKSDKHKYEIFTLQSYNKFNKYMHMLDNHISPDHDLQIKYLKEKNHHLILYQHYPSHLKSKKKTVCKILENNDDLIAFYGCNSVNNITYINSVFKCGTKHSDFFAIIKFISKMDNTLINNWLAKFDLHSSSIAFAVPSFLRYDLDNPDLCAIFPSITIHPMFHLEFLLQVHRKTNGYFDRPIELDENNIAKFIAILVQTVKDQLKHEYCLTILFGIMKNNGFNVKLLCHILDVTSIQTPYFHELLNQNSNNMIQILTNEKEMATTIQLSKQLYLLGILNMDHIVKLFQINSEFAKDFYHKMDKKSINLDRIVGDLIEYNHDNVGVIFEYLQQELLSDEYLKSNINNFFKKSCSSLNFTIMEIIIRKFEMDFSDTLIEELITTPPICPTFHKIINPSVYEKIVVLSFGRSKFDLVIHLASYLDSDYQIIIKHSINYDNCVLLKLMNIKLTSEQLMYACQQKKPNIVQHVLVCYTDIDITILVENGLFDIIWNTPVNQLNKKALQRNTYALVKHAIKNKLHSKLLHLFKTSLSPYFFNHNLCFMTNAINQEDYETLDFFITIGMGANYFRYNNNQILKKAFITGNTKIFQYLLNINIRIHELEMTDEEMWITALKYPSILETMVAHGYQLLDNLVESSLITSFDIRHLPVAQYITKNNLVSSELDFLIREKYNIEGELCGICQEAIETELFTCDKCRAKSHKSCIDRWRKEKQTCPYCRTTLIF